MHKSGCKIVMHATDLPLQDNSSAMHPACRSHMVLHCFWQCHAADFVHLPVGSFSCCLIMACLSWLFNTAVQCKIPSGLWSTAALYLNDRTCPSPLSTVHSNMSGPYARPYEITVGPRIASMIKVSRSCFQIIMGTCMTESLTAQQRLR